MNYKQNNKNNNKIILPPAQGSCGACGVNAQCTIVSGRPVCSCLPGYAGDPISVCKKTECTTHSDCPGHLTCQIDKCINPCTSVCGQGADCTVRDHRPLCSCPAGHTGDPFTYCRPITDTELCNPSPCGANTNCKVVNGVPTCTCIPGYFGSPIQGCRHECESNSDCGTHQACVDYKCQNPCQHQCGQNAVCEGAKNHAAVCKCPEGYFGNPYSGCRAECLSHGDCPSNKPTCIYNKCKNPCDGVCGVGANCELRGLTPVCSCPRDMTGDPFVRCRPFEPSKIIN